MAFIDQLIAQPYIFYPALFIASLCIGSFLNVVIHRLPEMMKRDWRSQCEEFLEYPEDQRTQFDHLGLATPRSRCPHCGHKITALENIPVISYLFLRGRCSGCQAQISPRYPIVELITGVLSVLTVYLLGAQWAGLISLALVWSLIALTLIDYDTQLLPDSITLPLLWLGLVVNYFGQLVPFEDAFWGAIVGYLALWIVYHLFRILTGKEGMGHGDFKLLSALGAWLGWQMLPAVILLSSLVGAVVGITLILFKGHDRAQPIPFGPYLAAAGLLTLLWGGELQALWYNFLGVH
ncbi:A24 family peptidase [Marinobacteraceae bacterium S3BR75-40.1]